VRRLQIVCSMLSMNDMVAGLRPKQKLRYHAEVYEPLHMRRSLPCIAQKIIWASDLISNHCESRRINRRQNVNAYDEGTIGRKKFFGN
jgi:hypothetical protein